MSKIHFEGDESLQKDLRTLCSEFSDIFSDKLAPQAADLKPFEINLPRQKWKVPSNHAPVRPQSSKKEHYLRTSIEVIHVDDMMISSRDEKHIDNIILEIERLCPGLSKSRGRVLNYIGMTFNFEQLGRVIIHKRLVRRLHYNCGGVKNTCRR